MPGHLPDELVPVPPQAVPDVLLLGVHVSLRSPPTTVLPRLGATCGGGGDSRLGGQHTGGETPSSEIILLFSHLIFR